MAFRRSFARWSERGGLGVHAHPALVDVPPRRPGFSVMTDKKGCDPYFDNSLTLENSVDPSGGPPE